MDPKASFAPQESSAIQIVFSKKNTVLQGGINFRVFEHIFASIITVCNAVFLASRFLLPPPQSPRCSSDYSRLARDWTAAPWARATKTVKKPVSHVEKLYLRFL